MKYCCETMKQKIEYKCDVHPDPRDCPDNLISYYEKENLYGLIVHDGGSSSIRIKYCPWCGANISDIDPWSNYYTSWQVFLNCSTENKARKILNKFNNIFPMSPQKVTIQSYEKTGFVSTFQTYHNNGSWNEYVFNMLQIAETVARNWILTGAVAQDLSGWSNDSNLPGIISISWQVFTRPDDDDGE